LKYFSIIYGSKPNQSLSFTMPGDDDIIFDGSYQAIGISSIFNLNPETCCRKCTEMPDPFDGYIPDECQCELYSVNNRDESDYINWAVCVMALLKNPGHIGQAKYIFFVWEGDVTKDITLRTDVDALVAPIQWSHGMYPTTPHHTIVLEPNGFESGDHQILSRISRTFERTGGGYQGLETSVINYIKRGEALLGDHCDRSMENVLLG
jgi:hypothetical protein